MKSRENKCFYIENIVIVAFITVPVSSNVVADTLRGCCPQQTVFLMLLFTGYIPFLKAVCRTKDNVMLVHLIFRS